MFYLCISIWFSEWNSRESNRNTLFVFKFRGVGTECTKQEDDRNRDGNRDEQCGNSRCDVDVTIVIDGNRNTKSYCRPDGGPMEVMQNIVTQQHLCALKDESNVIEPGMAYASCGHNTDYECNKLEFHVSAHSPAEVTGHPRMSCWTIIIDRVALAKQGDNAFGSIRLSVNLFVCLTVCLNSPVQTVWPIYELDFWYGARLWPRLLLIQF